MSKKIKKKKFKTTVTPIMVLHEDMLDTLDPYHDRYLFYGIFWLVGFPAIVAGVGLYVVGALAH